MERRVAIALIVLLFGCASKPPLHEIVALDRGAVRLQQSVVSDGTVHFFTFLEGKKRVNFLVRTDGKGRIRVHLDTCFSCYHYRQGFFVKGDAVVCRACRYSYNLDDEEWDYIGACAPIPLHFRLDDAFVIIEHRALARAARYF